MERTQIQGFQAAATFLLDGKRVAYSFMAAGYGDGTIRVFDTNKVEMIMKVQPHRTSVTDVVFASGMMSQPSHF